MADIIRVGSLEIDQDLRFQQRLWAVQRVGWVVIALVILATLAGLLGPGPLSSTTRGEQGGSLWMRYDRLIRYRAPTQLEVQLKPENVSQGKVTVWVSRSYIEKVQTQQVTPPPELVVAGPDRLTYVFRVSQPDQPTAVTFHLEPGEFGSLSGHIGLDNGQPLHFTQFVYP